MIRDKRIAVALGSAATVLTLMAGVQYAGVGSGYSLDEADAAGDSATVSVAALGGEPVRLPPWTEYGEVLSRPLFNESRAPELQATTAAIDPAAAGNAQPLNATLSGVIISGDVRLAFVTDNAKGETFGIRVGQPLEGDQSGWTLVELGPRNAVFEGAGLGRQSLELETDAKGAVPGAAPPPPAPAAVPASAAAQAAAPVPSQPAPQAAPNMPQPARVVAGGLDMTPAPSSVPQNAQPAADGSATDAAQQVANADEIRKRIEERRRQLREEAQRMLQQQNQTP